MRRDREQLPSSSSSSSTSSANPLSLTREEEEFHRAKMYISLVDIRQWKDDFRPSDFEKLFRSASCPRPLSVEVHPRAHGSFAFFPTLDQLIVALQCIQGANLPGFRDVRIHAELAEESRKKFALGEMLLENIPGDIDLHTVDEFIQHSSTPYGYIERSAKLMLPQQRPTVRSPHAFAFFRSVADAKLAARDLDGKRIDPRDDRSPRVKVSVKFLHGIAALPQVDAVLGGSFDGSRNQRQQQNNNSMNDDRNNNNNNQNNQKDSKNPQDSRQANFDKEHIDFPQVYIGTEERVTFPRNLDLALFDQIFQDMLGKDCSFEKIRFTGNNFFMSFNSLQLAIKAIGRLRARQLKDIPGVLAGKDAHLTSYLANGTIRAHNLVSVLIRCFPMNWSTKMITDFIVKNAPAGMIVETVHKGDPGSWRSKTKEDRDRLVFVVYDNEKDGLRAAEKLDDKMVDSDVRLIAALGRD